jgi:hypothetical protein
MYSRLAFKSFYSVLNLLGKRLDTASGSHMHKVVINVGCEPLAPFLWQEKTSYYYYLLVTIRNYQTLKNKKVYDLNVEHRHGRHEL